MSKHVSEIVTVVTLILGLQMSLPVLLQAITQKTPSLEAAKSLHAAGDSEKPKFEVISIKPTSPKPTRSGAYWASLKFLPGGKFVAMNENLNSLISTAYEIPYLQVMGIPKFIEKAFWNIEAKPEEGKYPLKAGLLDPHVGNLMIKSMLEDRFKLKVHQETRILPGYELVIAKGGPKIKLLKEKKNLGLIMPGEIIDSSVSLSVFANVLSGQFWMDNQKRIHVLDKTGLEGLYSINLRWTPDLRRPASNEPEVTLFDAIQDQLGLKLVPANIPTPVIVIDDVQMPGTN